MKLIRMYSFEDEVTFSIHSNSPVPGFELSPGHAAAINKICQEIRNNPLEKRMIPVSDVVEHPEQRSHYHKEVKRIDCECGRQHKVYIDVYAVLRAFKVKSHEVGHAIKKLLAAGSRGAKDYDQDIKEAGQSIEAEKRAVEEWV